MSKAKKQAAGGKKGAKGNDDWDSLLDEMAAANIAAAPEPAPAAPADNVRK